MLSVDKNKNFSKDGIYILGAREHNLKNINIFIPRNKITVITGLSGSGKSSLAFDTVYGEGQRRYLESVSVYARHFIDQMKKPEVDFIYGLSPSIAIHQKTVSHNPRSTVGTATEIYSYLRLLYSHLGEVFCPKHEVSLKSQTVEEIVADIESCFKDQVVSLLSPVARGKKGEFVKEMNYCLSIGFDRARINGEWVDLGQFRKLSKRKDHYIDILLDKLTIHKKNQDRIYKSVQVALSLSDGYIKIEKGKNEKSYSQHFSCPLCDYNFIDIDPKLFSFNSPMGACPSCNGTGLVDSEDNEDEEGDDFENPYCLECEGRRIRKEALNVKVAGQSISDLSRLSCADLLKFIKKLKFKGSKKIIADKIIEKILFHLSFLNELSLDYLSLDRSLSSLSGGEAQRVRLVSQLSSPVIGVLYVLDEPSIGLHSKDHNKILKVLKRICDRGNTIVMVEHDEESICFADKIIDLGPGAGTHGGHLIAEGTLGEIKKNKKSLTGSYLSGKKKIDVNAASFKDSSSKDPKQYLEFKKLNKNNLKNIDVKLPLDCLIGVSGVSGSGKSTLVNEIIYPCLSNNIEGYEISKDLCDKAQGLDRIKKVIQINQKPIGRTPRSNPVTYIGVFSIIRNLFSQLPESRLRGYTPNYFSFNVKGGRCENCMGAGSVKLEMRFLADVYTPCEVCQQKRYYPEILNITYKGKNISDVLNMTVSESVDFFKNHKYIHHKLKFLKDVGLGYLTLGQSSTTLSGGEAQRVKLSRELSKKTKDHTFYILDEPTTGLHFEDVDRLIKLLHQLVHQNNTVLVIEHHLDVLKSCDHLVDLGPEGGQKGGTIVAQGNPMKVSKSKKSYTGFYLNNKLKKSL
ncbi:MAG: excinuclease ABC subunit UvrA [Bdellovibrionales bacterium]